MTTQLGSWKLNGKTYTASHLDEGHIRLDCSNGNSWVLTNAEWAAKFRPAKNAKLAAAVRYADQELASRCLAARW